MQNTKRRALKLKSLEASNEMLRGIWSSLWTWDDCEEVCFPNDVRNELGEFLIARRFIDASTYTPLTTETKDENT